MTSYVPYIPNPSTYKNLEEITKGKLKKFYTAQQGKGSVNIVSPTQQAVERAKEDLKRNSSDQVSVIKRKRKATLKKKTVKKSKPSKKTGKTTKVSNSNKIRKRYKK